MNFNYIVNPESGKRVSIYGKTGKKVLQNYVKYLEKNGGNRKKKSKKKLRQKKSPQKDDGPYKLFEKKFKKIYTNKQTKQLLKYIKLNVKKNIFLIKNKNIYIRKQTGGSLSSYAIGLIIAAGLIVFTIPGILYWRSKSVTKSISSSPSKISPSKDLIFKNATEVPPLELDKFGNQIISAYLQFGITLFT